MNQDYINASQNYANDAKNKYEQSLSYLLTGLDEAKAADQEAANIRYNNLITQIRQHLPGIQEQFEKNAKAAYVNKQQNLQQIDADLSRLGVNTQGFGVTQRLLNESIYGQTYGQILSDYNNNLRDVANQETNALGDLNANLADLDAAYAKDKLDTQKYIGEQGLNIYNTAYKNYYNDLQYQDELKQQQYENEMAERKLAEQLKQQAWENAFKEKQRQDQLAQQQWERQMAEKEYQLNVRKTEASIAQANASIAASKAAAAKAAAAKATSNANEIKTTGKIVNTNYCKSRDAFSSNAAFDEYNKLLWQVMNDGGIDSGILNTYLNQGKSQGIFSSKDVKAIKSQFGI